MVGLSEADADDGGVGNLSTEVAMTELDGSSSMQRQLDEDEDDDDLNAITQHSQVGAPTRRGGREGTALAQNPFALFLVFQTKSGDKPTLLGFQHVDLCSYAGDST